MEYRPKKEELIEYCARCKLFDETDAASRIARPVHFTPEQQLQNIWTDLEHDQYMHEQLRSLGCRRFFWMWVKLTLSLTHGRMLIYWNAWLFNQQRLFILEALIAISIYCCTQSAKAMQEKLSSMRNFTSSKHDGAK